MFSLRINVVVFDVDVAVLLQGSCVVVVLCGAGRGVSVVFFMLKKESREGGVTFCRGLVLCCGFTVSSCVVLAGRIKHGITRHFLLLLYVTRQVVWCLRYVWCWVYCSSC